MPIKLPTAEQVQQLADRTQFLAVTVLAAYGGTKRTRPSTLLALTRAAIELGIPVPPQPAVKP